MSGRQVNINAVSDSIRPLLIFPGHAHPRQMFRGIMYFSSIFRTGSSRTNQENSHVSVV